MHHDGVVALMDISMILQKGEKFSTKFNNLFLNISNVFKQKCNKLHCSLTEARWENVRLTPVGEVYQIIFSLCF